MRKPKNLSLEPDAIERGQRYGRLHGKNLSQLVNDFLRARWMRQPRARSRLWSGACAESPPVGGQAARNIGGTWHGSMEGADRVPGPRSSGDTDNQSESDLFSTSAISPRRVLPTYVEKRPEPLPGRVLRIPKAAPSWSIP